jgi:hypothetical protein
MKAVLTRAAKMRRPSIERKGDGLNLAIYSKVMRAPFLQLGSIFYLAVKCGH